MSKFFLIPIILSWSNLAFANRCGGGIDFLELYSKSKHVVLGKFKSDAAALPGEAGDRVATIEIQEDLKDASSTTREVKAFYKTLKLAEREVQDCKNRDYYAVGSTNQNSSVFFDTGQTESFYINSRGVLDFDSAKGLGFLDAFRAMKSGKSLEAARKLLKLKQN